jgi:hypothetical protein
MDVFLTTMLAAIVAAVCVGWMVEDQVCARLRKAHPDLWESLGSPDRFFDDWGMARRSALSRLRREADLLGRCSADIIVLLNRADTVGKICLGVTLTALAMGTVHYFGRVIWWRD